MKAIRILCLATLSAFTGCNKPVEDLSALQTSVDELRATIDSLRKKTSEVRLELQKLSDERDEGEAAITRLGKESEMIEAQAIELTTAFMHYRNEYRQNIRQRATGMKLDDFDADGKAYRGVEVKEVDDWELSFKHQNGFTRIDLKDAPPEIRILFAYDPNVGPKPDKPLASGALAAASMPAGVGGASAAGGSSFGAAAGQGGDRRYAMAAGSGSPSSRSAYDPFATSVGSTVGEEMGYIPASPRKRISVEKGSKSTRALTLPDGSIVEVMTGW